MASPKAVGLTWTLSQTATDVVGVSRGMLEAATTDNVSMLALLSCEAFGALLPMSIETKAKVEKACSQDHQSAVLKFIKAQIGYKRGDSGWQLARSDSGLRFLGLAACLICTDNLWHKAELLRDLITDTAQDKILVPTSQQLKALLLVLEYRLVDTGFTNDVLGWNSLLNSSMSNSQGRHPFSPSNEVLKKLIQYVSSLARIGESTGRQLLKVKIPHSQAAWTIAFLRCCLGEPPTIVRQDGYHILHAENARAEVYPIADASIDPELAIWSELGSIPELVRGSQIGCDRVQGMVPAQTYIDVLCQEYGPKESPFYRNALQFIPAICCRVSQNLDVGSPTKKHFDPRFSPDQRQLLVQGIHPVLGSAFFDEETVLDTIAKFNGNDSSLSLARIPDGVSFRDLPLAQEIRQNCPCVDCLTVLGARPSCKFDSWLRKLSRHAATLLLLSLLIPIDTTGVMLHCHPLIRGITNRDMNDIEKQIYYHLFHGIEPSRVSVATIIGSLLILVGHAKKSNWIASSHLGQTIYPHLLQSRCIQSRGILAMMCVPGILSRDSVAYSRMETPNFDEILIPPPYRERTRLEPPVMIQDEWSSSKLQWMVRAGESELILSVHAGDLLEKNEKSPLTALLTMLDSTFISCPHDECSPCSDWHLLQGRPDFAQRKTDDDKDDGKKLEVGIIQTYRNEDIRYYSLFSYRPCVVREQACLDCCVRVARLLGLKEVLC